jgi:hypothetical protein
MATVRVWIAILTVRITLSVCPFNRMAHTANIGGFEIIVTSPWLFCYWIFGCIMKRLLERLGWEADW